MINTSIRDSMRDTVRHFLLALQFFTRIPITGRLAEWVGFSPELLRASAAHFPGVGIVVGICSAVSYWLSVQSLPHQNGNFFLAAVISCVASALLTGAFHEDGMADLADGLGGHVSREKSLEIMKDSRIGSYGALALILVLCMKLALLNMLGQISLDLVAMVIVLAHVISRYFPLFIIKNLPHVGDSTQSKSKPLADRISHSALGIATCWSLIAASIVVGVYPGWMWIGGIVLALMAFLWMFGFLRRRLAGFTGDALGATQQIVELAFYLGVLIAWRMINE